jgi:hypothetical protein
MARGLLLGGEPDRRREFFFVFGTTLGDVTRGFVKKKTTSRKIPRGGMIAQEQSARYPRNRR